MHKKVMSTIALLTVFLVSSGNYILKSPNNSTASKSAGLIAGLMNGFRDNLLIDPAEAVQLRDGKIYFVQLPTLLDAETTVNRTYFSGATYYFAIALPQNMGEPLHKLEIFQSEGFDSIEFIPDDTRSYLQSSSGDRVAISSKTEIGSSQPRQKITVTFDPPIPASSETSRKLTVGLRPIRNPRYDGVYLFGVTAAPQGDRPNSQFLGYGRLHFYDPHR